MVFFELELNNLSVISQLVISLASNSYYFSISVIIFSHILDFYSTCPNYQYFIYSFSMKISYLVDNNEIFICKISDLIYIIQFKSHLIIFSSQIHYLSDYSDGKLSMVSSFRFDLCYYSLISNKEAFPGHKDSKVNSYIHEVTLFLSVKHYLKY